MIDFADTLPTFASAAAGNPLFWLFDFILHIDTHLQEMAVSYGPWIYGVLFLIIFCETGLVVTPLLPGDSLLFAAGSLAAAPGSVLNPHLIFLLLVAAAILGDNTNYFIGSRIGPRVFQQEDSRIFKRKYLDKTQAFFARYGGKTIILARFVPIVRTFTPFVAGVGAMRYPRFLAFCLGGGTLWVGLFVYGGYLFGQLPAVQHNFKLVILGIILVSLLPMAFEFAKHKLAARKG